MANLSKPTDYVFGALAKFFSPTIKAAKELLQEKGPYEQLKITMLRNGAKADELEWSGADDFFKGKKVTKSEIIEYLTENDPRLNINTKKSDGGLIGVNNSGGSLFENRDFAVAQAMEDREMVNQAKLEILDDMRQDPQDIKFIESLDNVDSYLEGRVREGLGEQFLQDPPDFMNRFRIQVDNRFDVGDTMNSQYFPEGAENYKENLFQYFDPTGRINILQTAKSNHWLDDDYGTVFTSRTGTFPTTSGEKAMYVGEGQSDAFQKTQQGKDPNDLNPDRSQRKNLPRLETRNYNESLLVARFNELNEKARIGSNKLRENNRKMFANNLNDEELGRLGREAAIFQINKIIKDPTKQNDTFKDMASAFKIKDELPLDTALMTEDELEFLHYQLYNFDEFKGVNLLAGEDKRIAGEFSNRMQTAWTREPLGVEAVQEYMASKPVDWLNEGFRRYYGNLNADNMLLKMDILDARNEMKKIELDNFSGEQGFKKEGAPFMSSQNQWVDQVIGKSILDAVNDPSVDYLTFPDDLDAIAKVGGTNTPTEGAVSFYQKDVQNRLNKFLKKFDKNVQIEKVYLDPPLKFGEDKGIYGSSKSFSSKGFKITPEFREAVIKKGIPTFALPPVIGYGALNSMGENENGDQM